MTQKKSDRTIRHGWLRLLVATHVAVLKEVFFFCYSREVWCVVCVTLHISLRCTPERERDAGGPSCAGVVYLTLLLILVIS